MDRDAGGGYRMTFATPGSPPRAAKVVRAVGSRRYQQYLAAEGDTLWRLPVAYHIEEKRWFPMTGAFLFSDGASVDAPGRPTYGGGGVFDRHVTRWNDNCVFCHNVAPNPGRDPASGRVRDHGRRAGDRVRGLPRPGRARTRARNADPLRRFALHLGGARRSDDRQPGAPRARARRRPLRALPRPADRRRRRAVPDATAIRSWPATIWRATARRSGATRRSRGAGGRVRGALLGRRHAAADRLRIPGAACSRRCAQRAGSPAPAATACTRAIRAASSAQRFARRRRVRSHVHAVPRRARGAGRAGRSTPTTIRPATGPVASAATCRASSTACSTSTAATGSRSPSRPRGRRGAPRRSAPTPPRCVHALSRRGRSRWAGGRGRHAGRSRGRARRARGRRGRAGARAVVLPPTSARAGSGRLLEVDGQRSLSGDPAHRLAQPAPAGRSRRRARRRAGRRLRSVGRGRGAPAGGDASARRARDAPRAPPIGGAMALARDVDLEIGE